LTDQDSRKDVSPFPPKVTCSDATSKMTPDGLYTHGSYTITAPSHQSPYRVTKIEWTTKTQLSDYTTNLSKTEQLKFLFDGPILLLTHCPCRCP